MATESGELPQPLSHTRQATVDALCEHFANDVMPVEEFERRVDAAHRAGLSTKVARLTPVVCVKG